LRRQQHELHQVVSLAFAVHSCSAACLMSFVEHDRAVSPAKECGSLGAVATEEEAGTDDRDLHGSSCDRLGGCWHEGALGSQPPLAVGVPHDTRYPELVE